MKRKMRILCVCVPVWCGINVPELFAETACTPGATILRVDKDRTCANICAGGSNNGNWCAVDGDCPGAGAYCAFCGSTWTDAFQYLQDALATAAANPSAGPYDLWIAEGTYYPDDGELPTSGDRYSTFLMVDDVHLWGGFDGSEAACQGVYGRSVRDCNGGDYDGLPCVDSADCPGGSCTGKGAAILSGDLDGDDVTNCTSCTGTCVSDWCLKGDNAYHVVTYDDPDAEVRIDGVVIQSGLADGHGPTGTPFGVENQGAGLQIREFYRCSGGSNAGAICSVDSCSGGGTCSAGVCSGGSDDGEPCCEGGTCVDSPACLSGGPTLDQVLFRYNHASDHGGVNDHGSDTVYDYCVFRQNEAAKGAGLLVDNGSPTITNSLFEDNHTVDVPNEGGGAWFDCRENVPTSCPADCEPSIRDSVFVDNSAGTIAGQSSGLGGGAWFGDNTEPVLTDCTFEANEAGRSGFFTVGRGAGVFFQNSTPWITGCIFDSNLNRNGHIGAGGGGAWLDIGTGTATILDSEFVNNQVTAGSDYTAGGGLWHDEGTLHVERTVFKGNYAPEAGGGASQYTGAVSTYVNCVFVGNSINQPELASGGAFYMYGTGASTSADFVNTTFASNHVEADDKVGGVEVRVGSTADVTATNCIFWNNTSGDPPVADETAQAGDLVSITYSIVDGLTSCGPFDDCGIGKGCVSGLCYNVDADPDFVTDPDECDDDGWGDPPCSGACTGGTDNCDLYGNLDLGSNSGAIDAGDNCALDLSGCASADFICEDFDAALRRSDDAATTDTGNGTSPIVDMGAYEYDSDTCLSTEVCCEGEECVECCTDCDCESGETCNASNVCVSGTNTCP